MRAAFANGPVSPTGLSLSDPNQNPDSSCPCFEDISMIIPEFCCMILPTEAGSHACLLLILGNFSVSRSCDCAQREQPNFSQTMFRVTLRKHPLGSCLALCSIHQSKINVIESVSFLFVYAKTMGTLTSQSLSDTVYKIRGNNNVWVFQENTKCPDFFGRHSHVVFSKLTSMEVPFPPLSTSLSLTSSRLMMIGLRDKI